MKTLKDIKKLVRLEDHHNYGDIFTSVKTILLERDELQGTINGLKHLVELPKSAGLTELFNTVEALELNKSERDQFRTSLSELPHKNEQNVCELDAYRAGTHPDLKPQLSEIRYVLHGDIQPCSVLYSDDTTTLLRLDEGDVMCETDTIEWSDSVTYRCQELLKSAADPVHIAVPLKTSKLFAQLVRDERILLNDNGDDAEYPKTVRDDELFLNAETLWCCTECHHKFHVSLALCPQCHTPKTAPIKVDNFSSESLAPGSIEQPCDECSHLFDAQSMTCPMCRTIRSSEWTDNNSPTLLR